MKDDPGLIPGLGRSPGEGIDYPLQFSWASLVAQLVKNPPAIRKTWAQSLGWEDPLEKGMATHSSILAWRIPWTVWPTGLQRVRNNWATATFTFNLPIPTQGYFLDPGIKTTSPASLSLPGGFFTAASPGKSKNTGVCSLSLGVGSLSLLQQIFMTQELNRDLLHCRLILYQLSYQGALWNEYLSRPNQVVVFK